MSAFANVFFPQRLARLPFLARCVPVLGAIMFAGVLMAAGDALGLSGAVRLMLDVISCILLVIGLFCLFRSVLFPRLRDVGLHPLYSFVILIPYLTLLFLIALFFIPTDAFAKRIGGGDL